MGRRMALAALYCAGALAVAVLLLLTAAGPECVLFPEAMLPMDLRELASAWLGIGFLPMLLVSVRFYKAVRRRAVFVPAGICLLAVLFWVGTWAVGLVRGPDSAGDIVLPEPERIASARFTGSGLDLTFGGDAFVSQLLRRMSQAKDTGRESVGDVPGQAGELVRIDLNFKRLAGKGRGGTSTVFLYRDGGELLLEQPYQGIYRVNGDLELWLGEQIAGELAKGMRHETGG